MKRIGFLEKSATKKFFKEKMMLTGFVIAKGMSAMPVYAAGVINTGVPELDTMLNTIINLLAGIVSAYGVIKLINGIRAWSDGNEEMDQARKSQGMNTIMSGGLCVLVFPVLQILGIAIN